MTTEPNEPNGPKVIPFTGDEREREARRASDTGITRKDYDEAMTKQESSEASVSDKAARLIIKLEVVARYLGHVTPQEAAIGRRTVPDFAFRQLWVDAHTIMCDAQGLEYSLGRAKKKARKYRKKWKAAK